MDTIKFVKELKYLMKRKMVVCLTGSILTMALCSTGVQAMTLGLDHGKKVYTITYEGEETTDKGSVQSAEEDVEITVREHGEQSEQATEDAFGVDIVTDNPEAEKKVQEYKENGIDKDDSNGSWNWNGKEVQVLMDEDGSFYQNGSEAAKEAQIYLIVKRDDGGEIQKVKQITLEEVMEKLLAFQN